MMAVADRRRTDDHLGELTASGDVEAFAALYARHFPGIYDLAMRVVRDADTAAEVVCESLTASWAALRKGAAEDVRASLYVAVYLAAVAHARAGRDAATRNSGADPNFTALDTRRLADLAAVLREPELVRRVWESATALDPRDYALLDLQLRKGLGPRELAAGLGARRATIDARLARIKEELVRSVAAGSDGETGPASLAVFAALGWWINGPRLASVFFVVCLLMAATLYWYGPRIVLASLGARELTLAEGALLHTTVERLALRAGVSRPRLYLLADGHPRALAVGRGASASALALSQGLVGALPPAELEGVIAHELAKVKHRDVVVQTPVVVLAGWLVDHGFDPLVIHTTAPGEDGEEEPARVSLVWFAVAKARNDA